MKKLLPALILIVSLMPFSSHAAEIPDFISIGINASSLANEVTLESDGGVYTDSAFAKPEEETGEIYFYIADKVEITVSENDTLLCEGTDTGESEISFYKTSEFISCQGREYRGAIKLSVRRGKILIINILSMDEYLYGVVGREMSPDFPIEALKAQCVAARNYAVISIGRHSSEGFDLCNGVHCQAYGAVASESDSVRKAVDETEGELLFYEGELAECYYYSSNGGYIESSENVWYAKIGYLRGKLDPYENPETTPNYTWEETFTAEEIKKCLASRDIDIGDIKNIEVTEYSDNNHVIEIKITGTEGDKYYYKDNIRAAFPRQLKSTYFTVTGSDKRATAKVLTVNGLESRAIEPSFVLSADGLSKISAKGKEGEFIFSGGGYGHGVGMSQYGAMNMANLGYTYDEILKFYYEDTEIIGNES